MQLLLLCHSDYYLLVSIIIVSYFTIFITFSFRIQSFVFFEILLISALGLADKFASTLDKSPSRNFRTTRASACPSSSPNPISSHLLSLSV